MMETKIPQGFTDYISCMMGDEGTALLNALDGEPAVSVRLNRRKSVDPEDIGYGRLEPVKWCGSGYYLDRRPVFTLNPLLHAGVFYVQEASSMIYEAIAEKIVPMAFDTGHPLKVLDLCAAPGGKTTALINALPDGTLVVANEFVPQRAAILKENLLKWGYPEIMVTNSPTDRFRKTAEMFDIVAVDAPCSGEGMMRKEAVAREQWSEQLVSKCAALQRDILRDAFEALKPGGFLIYSTCTFNRKEDEENLAFLVDELSMAPLDMEFPAGWGISPGIDTPYPCLRFMPHVTRGEGLFAAVLRKEGDYPSARHLANEKVRRAVAACAKVTLDGIPRTTMKGKEAAPTSESALATDFDTGKYPAVEVDLDTALSYLRHEALRLDAATPKGYVTVNYKGFPLGFVKNIGSRANNLFPQSWKIRMNV